MNRKPAAGRFFHARKSGDLAYHRDLPAQTFTWTQDDPSPKDTAHSRHLSAPMQILKRGAASSS